MDVSIDNRPAETWDRLVLLLITRPCAGWEAEFEEITRREIERLKPVRGENTVSSDE
jgi:hypothetical protein